MTTLREDFKNAPWYIGLNPQEAKIVADFFIIKTREKIEREKEKYDEIWDDPDVVGVYKALDDLLTEIGE